jgi:hypothetical protein
MDVNRSHLVADINSVPEEMQRLFTQVPKHLQAEAERELAGRSEAHVNPNKKVALNAWAAAKRKKNRAKSKQAKASRKKNRA